MRLKDLESTIKGENDIKLLKFSSEDSEFEFVIQRIIASSLQRNEIFVLARTNRQLNELSHIMKFRGIKHVVKSDEIRRSTIAGENDITLATIHAIKGMEAKMVFVIGCNGVNFPCKGSEHPVIDMVKVDEYDKEEEERRLFYVAMSRARNSLYLTYSGNKPTNFITDEMLKIMESKKLDLNPIEVKTRTNVKQSTDIVTRLRDWRKSLSNELSIPAFMIMHDKTLIDLAQKKPMTMTELENVHGLGPTKIMKYGEELLELVSS